ncbi:hypothetical protein LNP04_18590 [Chryseobacterium sp. C-71]|uniref:hypothetical protein n=1 Tax=Chryseobacterium sp. C-71 TaxID=2893882 RepID=UPI001E43E58E|nr:hypothetical protein [Chryseobacterium sp. C-71]UFH31949.1 hypothetical protein LNP04_18590 [Chryseobacterium sp. C-71]
MEDIFLDKSLDNGQIINTMSEVFSGLTTFHWDFNDNEPEKIDFNNPNHIFFNTKLNFDVKEFSFNISIYRTPNTHYEERQFYLSKIFSDKYNIKTFASFTKPDDPDDPDDPYYSIVFEKGKTYLANDIEFYNSNKTGIIKILEEYDLPSLQFDHKARYIKK